MKKLLNISTQKEKLDVAHTNTILSQLLHLIPRHVFEALERKHSTGRKARKFSRWNQFVCLAFIHLSARRSMRDGIRNLIANARRLYHLGAKPVSRSTFSDANNKRPAALYQALFGELYHRCQSISPVHKFRFKNKLFSLDSSTIKLCLTAFPWASFRKKRGGVKLHTLLDHDGYIPSFLKITEARQHDSKIAEVLKLPKGSIVAFDKAYNNYKWFAALCGAGVFFVTRLKDNAKYTVLKRRTANRKLGVTSDQIIQVKTSDGKLKLRRVGYYCSQTHKHYEFLTNHFDLSAKTIADIYKERWQIEIFFRLIKQNLKLKSFVGNSENAVFTQVYVAMIVHLLLAYFRFVPKIDLSFQKMIQLLQLNLLKRTCLEEFFKSPKEKPDIKSGYPLLELAG